MKASLTAGPSSVCLSAPKMQFDLKNTRDCSHITLTADRRRRIVASLAAPPGRRRHTRIRQASPRRKETA
jgi:hypothetical protein